jgi:hypothetical protein
MKELIPLKKKFLHAPWFRDRSVLALIRWSWARLEKHPDIALGIECS